MTAEQIAFKMTSDLSRMGHIYEQVIDWSFDAICYQYGIEKTDELRDECIERTRKALEILFS